MYLSGYAALVAMMPFFMGLMGTMTRVTTTLHTWLIYMELFRITHWAMLQYVAIRKALHLDIHELVIGGKYSDHSATMAKFIFQKNMQNMKMAHLINVDARHLIFQVGWQSCTYKCTTVVTWHGHPVVLTIKKSPGDSETSNKGTAVVIASRYHSVLELKDFVQEIFVQEQVNLDAKAAVADNKVARIVPIRTCLAKRNPQQRGDHVLG